MKCDHCNGKGVKTEFFKDRRTKKTTGSREAECGKCHGKGTISFFKTIFK